LAKERESKITNENLKTIAGRSAVIQGIPSFRSPAS